MRETGSVDGYVSAGWAHSLLNSCSECVALRVCTLVAQCSSCRGGCENFYLHVVLVTVYVPAHAHSFTAQCIHTYTGSPLTFSVGPMHNAEHGRDLQISQKLSTQTFGTLDLIMVIGALSFVVEIA